MSDAHHIGTVAWVEAGHEVWSTERRIVNDPIGGVVITVTETHDPETGERVRSFQCVDGSGPELRWSTIREDELGPESVAAPEHADLLALVRRLAGEVAWYDGRRRRHGMPDEYEARCARAVVVLLGVLGLDSEREACQRMLDASAVASMWRKLAEAVAMSKGPLSTDMAQRAFAVDELQHLVFGPNGILHGVLERKTPGKAATPRPTAPPKPAAWYVD